MGRFGIVRHFLFESFQSNRRPNNESHSLFSFFGHNDLRSCTVDISVYFPLIVPSNKVVVDHAR